MTKSKQKSEQYGAWELADRLHSTAIHLLRAVRKRDAESGEGPARLSALSVLVFGGPMTLGQLATAEQVKPPTMTRIVAGLERGGLAKRISDRADARKTMVHPTAKGKRLLQAARERRIESLAERLEKLGRRELEALDDAATILSEILKA
ncbi:MAG TPA: MarR family transcriptional regulator [Terriglobales bacterium]|nr:MarR family transcriptional regulator [Terriglobales bacterium]